MSWIPSTLNPSFEADHMGGLSVWRGKFNQSSGVVTFDKEASTGTIQATIKVASIDFGHEKMNEHAKSADMFDVAKYPTANYSGNLTDFKAGKPTKVAGVLTLKGVSRPVELQVNSFLCTTNPLNSKDTCGADLSGTFDREQFGVAYGKDFGFNMDTRIQVQVEAVREQNHE